ncbi:hypothetical protein CK203_050313 [Vitis vinifera]|uniref:Uncharacterized protein n=1 Tax=Vitis vinifera TaxID=29760 RepID=A0A438GZV2_VITVI|nr:hypothetical protein CK203_050313 [Vitis vinifera]
MRKLLSQSITSTIVSICIMTLLSIRSLFRIRSLFLMSPCMWCLGACGGSCCTSTGQTGGSADPGYNSYAAHGSMYASPASNPAHASHTGGYGPVNGANYGY